MRALILLLTAAWSPGFAAAAEKQQVVISLEVQGHYSKTYTKVFKRKGEWFCETELARIYPLSGPPSALELIPARIPAAATGCRDTVRGQVNQEGKRLEISGCTSDPLLKSFLEALSKDCGR